MASPAEGSSGVDGVGAHCDTIAAVSTALGGGAIGIVRISGPDATKIVERAFLPVSSADIGSIGSFTLTYGHVVDPVSGNRVDEALLGVMRAPRSYTREDVAELHCHGGAVAVQSVLRLMVSLGARVAEPGEFTRRAFLNGRIDLAQAEGVAAIVAARSTGALRVSMRQLDGGLSGRLRSIREELVQVLARIEANVDFSDEDIEEVDWASAGRAVEESRGRVEELLKTALLGQMLQHGVQTAIVGNPNVGKSSLLNALVMKDRAIVSDVPGTTRDTVEGELEIGGIPVRLVDTAGVRGDGDEIERLGIERSLLALERADLVLVVVDLSMSLTERDLELVAKAGERPVIVVGNKMDVTGRGSRQFLDLKEAVGDLDRGEGRARETVWVCETSALTGEGVDEVRSRIEDVVCGGGVSMEEPILVGERQRRLVSEAALRLEEASKGVEENRGEELVAEDVRAAAVALGRVTGEDLAEDLLDEIFSRFCVGK